MSSDMAVAGALAAHDEAVVDAEICLGDIDFRDPERVVEPYQLRGDQLLFDAPGVARYLSTSGKRLDITPDPCASPEDVEALLIATALPMLIWMRGGFVLHAGAVILPGQERAIAIIGASGSGKSSVIDGLMARGARLVGDDTLSISLEGEAVTVTGLAGGYFMRDSGARTRNFVAVSVDRAVRSAELGALFVLDSQQTADGTSLTALAPIKALEALLRHRHRPKIPSVLRRDASAFTLCSLLCQRLPVYRLHRAEGNIGLTAEAVVQLSGSNDGV